MIVEERMYVLHTEVNIADYMAIYTSEGLPLQREILGGFLGYFTTEIGTQNQLVHFWAYADLEERRKRREKAGGAARLAGVPREDTAHDHDHGEPHPRSHRLLPLARRQPCRCGLKTVRDACARRDV